MEDFYFIQNKRRINPAPYALQYRSLATVPDSTHGVLRLSIWSCRAIQHVIMTHIYIGW